jgi:hypothetical protein
MLVVEVTDLTDPSQAVGVAELAAERETRVRGVGDEPSIADELDYLADCAWLGVDRMHVEVPGHAASLGPVSKTCGLWHPGHAQVVTVAAVSSAGR